MRVIAHISDLHFGREDRALQEELLADLERLRPDLVVISGDLTQRARTKEFTLAKEFLNRIPFPSLVVPGNHDIPFYNVSKRFLRPLKEYKRHISDCLNPFYTDDEIAVLGINTARSLSGFFGKISKKQIRELRTQFDSVDASRTKIIVTHHPFVNSRGKKLRIIPLASVALRAIEGSGVDVILAGHLHLGYNGDVSSAYPTMDRSIIVAHAGTAISTHHRRGQNSFNVLRVSGSAVHIELRMWNGERYLDVQTSIYERSAPEHRWQLTKSARSESSNTSLLLRKTKRRSALSLLRRKKANVT